MLPLRSGSAAGRPRFVYKLVRALVGHAENLPDITQRKSQVMQAACRAA
jgi:hypothetical protein